jgi:hypothetical protein
MDDPVTSMVHRTSICRAVGRILGEALRQAFAARYPALPIVLIAAAFATVTVTAALQRESGQRLTRPILLALFRRDWRRAATRRVPDRGARICALRDGTAEPGR